MAHQTVDVYLAAARCHSERTTGTRLRVSQESSPAFAARSFGSTLRMTIAAIVIVGCCAKLTANDRAIDFTRDIQPILSDNCYKCHGPDASKRKGELRLDALDPKQGPFAPRDGYSILAPADLENSVLIMRITS